MTPPTPSQGALAVYCLGCLITDLREQKIYNKWTFPFLGLALVLAAAGEGPPPADAALGVLLGFLILFPFWAAGKFAAGDAKMLMTLGAFLGWRALPDTVLWGFLAVGACSAAAIAYDTVRLGGFGQYLGHLKREAAEGVGWKDSIRTNVPAGVGFALGAAAAQAFPLDVVRNLGVP